MGQTTKKMQKEISSVEVQLRQLLEMQRESKRSAPPTVVLPPEAQTCDNDDDDLYELELSEDAAALARGACAHTAASVVAWVAPWGGVWQWHATGGGRALDALGAPARRRPAADDDRGRPSRARHEKSGPPFGFGGLGICQV